jgi:hypothetical protein
MVCVLSSSVVYRGIEPWSDQTQDYKIGICCLSVKNIALRNKSKDWSAPNQNNVATCLPADCCFSELVLHHHLIEIQLAIAVSSC